MGEELGAGAPVAVLAAHRTTELAHHRCCFLDERAVAPGAVRRGQREIDAAVDAAVTEVAVGEALETVLREQRVEFA